MRKPYLEQLKLEVDIIKESLVVFETKFSETIAKINNVHVWDRMWERFWCANTEYPEGVRVGIAKRGVLASFLAHKGTVYKIAEEFGKELEKVDLNIPNKFIPEKQFICIELPDSVNLTHSGMRITSIFVMYDQSPLGDQKLLSVEACVQDGTYTFRSRYDLSNPEETILDALNRNRHISKNTYRLDWSKGGLEPVENQSDIPNVSEDIEFEETLTLYKYLIKCLVYIGSGDPDLREYRAPKCDRKSEKKRKNWERKHSDQSLIDMVFVGFDFKKERVYKTDGIWVETFPRWQRYGENLRYVKLIWVKPHQRHYKKEG